MHLRDPFRVVNPNNVINQSADKNTRVVVFVANLNITPAETSTVVIHLIDANNQTYDISAEDVRPVPMFAFLQVVFRLPNSLSAGTCVISVMAKGQTTNTGTSRIVM